MTNLVVLQPNYLPWRGYFDLIQKADVFVFLDDVQYTKNDWRNRNIARQPDGRASWLTVPVSASLSTAICEATIDYTYDWRGKHLKTLNHCYRRSVGFPAVRDMLESAFAKRPQRLVDLTIPLTIKIAKKLGAETEFLLASGMDVSGDRNVRLVAIAKAVGTTTYLSGPAARTYLEPSLWDAAGIRLRYFEYPKYPPYRTGRSTSGTEYSIVDLMCLAGDDAPGFIWGMGSQQATTEANR